MSNRLFVRDRPDAGEINTRAAVAVPDTLDEDLRTVRWCLTTEDPARVYDWRTGDVILETLIVAGCESDPQTPLIRDHSQYSVNSILGSVVDVAAAGDELLGTLEFGRDIGGEAEEIWQRVRQGHLRRGSVGYSYGPGDYVTIPAGETRDVNGRSFTAPKNSSLRVVFRWRLNEFSMVVIPADERAQARASAETPIGTVFGGGGRSATHESEPAPGPNDTAAMNRLLAFLRCYAALGADASFDDAAATLAWARSNLDGRHNAGLIELCREESIEFDADHFPVDPPPDEPERPGKQRNAPEDPDAGMLAERQRQQEIRDLHRAHPHVADDIVENCLKTGLTLDETKSRFLDSIRGGAAPPVPPVPPAGHVRGGMTLRTLQAGLMLRLGISPDDEFLTAKSAESVFSQHKFNTQWMRGAARTGADRDRVESAFDDANRLKIGSGSLMRMCEALCRFESDSHQMMFDENEIIERTFSSANFGAIFGAAVHLMMIRGYETATPMYRQFCRTIEVANFNPHKQAHTNGVGKLRKQGLNGGKPAILNPEDPIMSSVAIDRYAGQIRWSDQVMINDTFEVTGSLPDDVGASAAEIPNDLAYAGILGNFEMADGDPLFKPGDNLITGATIDEAGVNEALTMLQNKEVGGRRIQVRDVLLLHGTTNASKIKKVHESEVSPDGTKNVERGTFTRAQDNAIDLGVDDPAKDIDPRVDGRPESYYLFARPLRSLVVAFLRGRNQAPRSRSGVIPVGEGFGRIYDIYLDCGFAGSTRIGSARVDTTG